MNFKNVSADLKRTKNWEGKNERTKVKNDIFPKTKPKIIPQGVGPLSRGRDRSLWETVFRMFSKIITALDAVDRVPPAALRDLWSPQDRLFSRSSDLLGNSTLAEVKPVLCRFSQEQNNKLVCKKQGISRILDICLD